MRNLKIGTRLLLLLFIPLVVLLIVGANAYTGFLTTNKVFSGVERGVKETNSLNALAATIRAGLLDPVNGVNFGTLSWEEAGQRLASALPQVERMWNDYLATIDEDDQTLCRPGVTH